MHNGVEHVHIVMYSEKGATQLKSARTLYLDGTFKSVKAQPYIQLFTGHVMATALYTGQMKQFPHLYVLMTRKSKEDYRAVSVPVVV